MLKPNFEKADGLGISLLSSFLRLFLFSFETENKVDDKVQQIVDFNEEKE